MGIITLLLLCSLFSSLSFGRSEIVPIHATNGEIPACACVWPSIANGLAAKEQLCPPPGIKCNMCMESVHMIRYEKHPRSACASFAQREENVNFCNTLGDEMFDLKDEVKNAIVVLSKKYGPNFGASLEICSDLKCCQVPK